jgi:hypothetical protein
MTRESIILMMIIVGFVLMVLTLLFDLIVRLKYKEVFLPTRLKMALWVFSYVLIFSILGLFLQIYKLDFDLLFSIVILIIINTIIFITVSTNIYRKKNLSLNYYVLIIYLVVIGFTLVSGGLLRIIS